MNTTPTTLSEYFTAERTKRGLNQNQFADMLMVTSSSYSRWEHGQGSPRPSTLRAIAALLNTSYAELVVLIPEPPLRKKPEQSDPDLITLIAAISRLSADSFTHFCWLLMKHQPHAQISHPAITGYDFTYQDQDNLQWRVHCLHRLRLGPEHAIALATYYTGPDGPRKLFMVNRRFSPQTNQTIAAVTDPRIRYMDSRSIVAELVRTQDPHDRKQLADFVRSEVATNTQTSHQKLHPLLTTPIRQQQTTPPTRPPRP